jgi:hypothetical protein
MPGSNGVKITGLRELDRALGKYDTDVRKGLRAELKLAADPVRSRAEALAVSGISNMGGGPWARMRVGVLTKGSYVAPKSRGRGGSPRPNLAGELYEAMSTALDETRVEVFALVEGMLDRAAGMNGF